MQKYRPKYTLLAYPQVTDYTFFFEIVFLKSVGNGLSGEERKSSVGGTFVCEVEQMDSMASSHFLPGLQWLCLKAENMDANKSSGWKNFPRSASSPKHCSGKKRYVCLSQTDRHWGSLSKNGAIKVDGCVLIFVPWKGKLSKGPACGSLSRETKLSGNMRDNRDQARWQERDCKNHKIL